MKYKKITGVVMFAFQLALSQAAVVEIEKDASPSVVVKHLQDNLIHVMKRGKGLSYEGRYSRLEPVVHRAHGMDKVSRIILGTEQWEKLSAEQQITFVDAFTEFTIATYAAQFKKYNNQVFKIREESDTGRGRKLVKTAFVKSNGSEIDFDYVLEKTDNGWQIINIVVSGISDLALKRTEYAFAINQHGFNGFIKKLNEKINIIAASGKQDV